MSFKKPRVSTVVSDRPLCPICRKPSYSAAGVHPQCSFARADAALKAARIAEMALVEAQTPKAAPVKECPRCQRPRKRAVCPCGYRFSIPR